MAIALAACGPVEMTEPAQPRTTPPDPSAELTVQERFLWVAFHHDDGTPRTLERWEAPIQAAVFNPGSHLPAIEAQLSQLSALTGLTAHVDADPDVQMRGIAPPEDYNMAIVMGRSEELYPFAEEYSSRFGSELPARSQVGCFFFSDIRRPQRPLATIVIPNDLSPYSVRQCIVQETAQVLGLFGDLDGRSDTAFAGWSAADHLTYDDQQIVRLFYDDRLRPGMTPAEALTALSQ